MSDKLKKFFSATKNVAKRSTVAILCMVLVGLFAIMSCDKLQRLRVDELVEAVKGELFPICKDVMFSECNMSLEENEEDSILLVDTVTETMIGDLRILYKDEHLHITHKEMYVVCGFTEINVTTLINGNAIEVNIEPNGNLNCVCFVDVSYSIGKLEHGMCELIFKYNNLPKYSQTISF